MVIYISYLKSDFFSNWEKSENNFYTMYNENKKKDFLFELNNKKDLFFEDMLEKFLKWENNF